MTFVLAGQIRAQCGMDFVSEKVAHATLLWQLWHRVVAGQLGHSVAWVGSRLDVVFWAREDGGCAVETGVRF